MYTVLSVTAFLLWVNFLPPLANLIWGERFNRPLDGGRLWFDQHPVFGPHKTIRGVAASLLGGTAVAPLLGLTLSAGIAAAGLAMAGDLVTSFVKRRPNLPSGSNVLVFDQLFESLFPSLYLKTVLEMSWLQLLAILLCFIPVATLGSWFWNFVMLRTPLDEYPRELRSKVRLRELSSCHTPLARWQTVLNLGSVLGYDILTTGFFKLSGLWQRGQDNGLRLEVVEQSFFFPDLPRAFDGFQILLLTDLHLDGVPGITARLSATVEELEPDLCLLGGDIRMKTYGPMAPCLKRLRRLLSRIRSHYGVFAVLGNHDCVEMTVDMEESGIVVLINDSWEIRRNSEQIWLVGLDDPHYYRTDDVAQALRDVPDNGFTLLLAHSPEAYKKAAQHGARLYLCGHTHGGQICFPARGPIMTHSRAPRFTAAGHWSYRGMTGYTSRGVGSSGVPLRFCCPGEITLLTLRRGAGYNKDKEQ